MMSLLNIRDAKKLEGWFCRARKRHKQRDVLLLLGVGPKKKESTEINNNMDVTSPTAEVNHTDQLQVLSQGSSNFDSLLSAAKSELGVTHTSPPDLHASNQVLENQPQRPEQTQISSKRGSYQHLGAREQAILSSFQSLQSMEIHDRSSRRTSPTAYSSYPEDQQQRASAEYPCYQHTQGRQQTSPAGCPPYQYPQTQEQASPATYQPHQHAQGQPPEYSSHQHPHDQQQASSVDCSQQHKQLPNYHHSHGHQQAPPAEYPYRHSGGQQQASPAEYP